MDIVTRECRGSAIHESKIQARPGPRRDIKCRPEEDVSQWPPPGTKYTGGVLDQLTHLVCVLRVLLITIYITEQATNC